MPAECAARPGDEHLHRTTLLETECEGTLRHAGRQCVTTPPIAARAKWQGQANACDALPIAASGSEHLRRYAGRDAPRRLVALLATRRAFSAMLAFWACLAVPAAALADHTCYGFVGFLAHLPIYGFQVLTPVLVLIALAVSARGAPTARG